MHKEIVVKYNIAVEDRLEQNKPLEETIMVYRDKSDEAFVFNAASQCWNWIFMWMCMWPSKLSLLACTDDDRG